VPEPPEYFASAIAETTAIIRTVKNKRFTDVFLRLNS
jgi:hypothetical protein